MVVDSGVIPKLVPLLKHKEGRIVVRASATKTPLLMLKDIVPVILLLPSSCQHYEL